MKSSIIPEVLVTGKKLLAFQCEGVDVGALWSEVDGQQVVAYAMPDGHSLQAAWLFWLILDGGGLLEFSSASTRVVGWHEIGSLNIRFVSRSCREINEAGIEVSTIAIPALHLRALEKLVYEDADVIAECALVLNGEVGEKIVVAVGIPPGAVSVALSFIEEQFEPQFAISKCRHERL